MATYGDKINKLAETSFKVYIGMIEHPIDGIDDVRGMAEHDLKMQIFCAERALEKLAQKIEEYNKKNNIE